MTLHMTTTVLCTTDPNSSKNRGITIQTKNSKDQGRIGSRSGFSSTDIKQINKMYCGGSSEGSSGGSGGNGGNGGSSSCADKDSRCSGWKSYCSSNSYVKTNCKKTCSLCPSVSCVDKDTRCSGWTRYCSNHSYVKANCKKTCSLC